MGLGNAPLAGWTPVGSFAQRIYAIRPYSAQVPRAVQAFVGYLRAELAGGLRCLASET